ncbi:MAG TPA: hypothetical protein VFK82_09230 [Burkholderiaceae bacterium]|nr:hypothetical protein [Burkholderiaceae bacterium]
MGKGRRACLGVFLFLLSVACWVACFELGQLWLAGVALALELVSYTVFTRQ